LGCIRLMTLRSIKIQASERMRPAMSYDRRLSYQLQIHLNLLWRRRCGIWFRIALWTTRNWGADCFWRDIIFAAQLGLDFTPIILVQCNHFQGLNITLHQLRWLLSVCQNCHHSK
jgi:hypothetical protein